MFIKKADYNTMDEMKLHDFETTTQNPTRVKIYATDPSLYLPKIQFLLNLRFFTLIGKNLSVLLLFQF